MSSPVTEKSSSFGARVAAEIRAEMARQRISVNRMDGLCDKPRGWAQRRLQQESVVLDLDDLEVIARVLRIDVRRLLATLPTEVTDPYLLRRRRRSRSYVVACGRRAVAR